MLKCYTISSLKSLKEFPNLDVCQFTLNFRTPPGKRKTVELLKTLSKASSTKVIVHYDFIFIASRFAMFASKIQEDIINELCSILEYSAYDSRILGVVMHTDFPIKKAVLINPTLENFKEEYKSSIWNIPNPETVLSSLDTVLEDNLLAFCNALNSAIIKRNLVTRANVYFENTTKVGPNNQGSFGSLLDFYDKHKPAHIGLCLDSEHFFAVDGSYPFDITGISAPLIYHLNTIPSEVLPKSKKDRHSLTTITECSVVPLQSYLTFTDYLEGLGIPYVREVKEETMFRELNQLQELGVYGQ